MKSTLSNLLFISGMILSIQTVGKSQISAFIKSGINFGFINKETWYSPDYPESFDYGKPLIRPILAFGIEHTNKKLNLSFTFLYQTKGQGSISSK